MKLKRLKKCFGPDGEFTGYRRVRDPFEPGKHDDYTGENRKDNKVQRAKHRRKLLAKYGPKPESPRPLDAMSHAERRALRAEVLADAGYRCEQCGDPRRLTLDHIVARHIGGGHHRGNLQCLCEPCNKAKGLDIWRAGDGLHPAPFL